MELRMILSRPASVTLVCFLATTLLLVAPSRSGAQKDLPEVTVATAVSVLAFAAVWVAEQLKYFEEEGVRVKLTVAGGGSPCLAAVVGRSVHFCASSSEGLILARLEGAPLVTIQAHNRAITLGITVRKEIVDKSRLTRESPLAERLNLLTQLGTIGATSPGAVSEQIFKFLVLKAGGNPDRLKFAYLGGAELPAALMNNIIDTFAQSPPGPETTEAQGKGYVLIALSRGEMPELRDYPYEVLMARPDFVEKNPKLARAVARAISRGGALFHTSPQAAKAALRAHRFSNPQRMNDAVFDLSFSLIKDAMPRWGDMSSQGWQKVIDFSLAAGIIKDPSKAPSAKEGVLWTNQYVGRSP
ncbi:MAG: ABC transporter substrate-binding protein [Deltaproteobacteria bacterium]|nr:ABC transporter substrate-binding protein [Deltaproteobacteria bacterium]